MKGIREGKQKSDKTVEVVSYYQQLLHNAQCRDDGINTEELGWFDIKNYNFVRTLSLRNLMTELVVRGTLCTSHNSVAWDGTVLGQSDVFKEYYPKITSGKPSIHQQFISHEKIPDLNYLINTDESISSELVLPVQELSIGDIDACYNALFAADNEFYTLEESLHPCYTGHKSKSTFEADTPLTTVQAQASVYGVEQIYLAIDTSFTESQLIASFKEMLTNLNIRHGIFKDCSEQKTKQSQKVLYDIYAYHIIPLIDLVLWQIHNKKQIPLKMVYNLLNKNPLNESGTKTGYSETNFKSRNLRTFDLILNHGDPGQVVSRLIGKTKNYDVSLYDATHS